MNGLGPSPFSPHSDVLTANPTTPTAILSLLTELKSRGRTSVSTKRYEDAVALYTKAIELNPHETAEQKKDMAILYSNRSLCHLQMNQVEKSQEDAISATSWDETYVKGFWRLGQACFSMQQYQEAKDAYETALALEEGNKALKKELVKVEKALEKQKKEEEEKAKKEAEAQELGEELKEEPPVTKPVPTKPQTTKSSSSTQSTNTTTKAVNDGTFSKSDHVRGYKIVNGKKTSFFHHEQTEEEKRLIGDIAPKRLDPTSIPPPSSSSLDNQAPKDRSAWNQAGTWEEKDCTAWAIESLTKTLMECTYTLPAGCSAPNAQIIITKVSNLIDHKTAGGTAHASVATVRGKKRYIFEFDIKLEWQLTLPSGETCKGTLRLDDVDGTHEVGEGLDVREYSVTDAGPGGDIKFLLERFVRNDGLRGVVEKSIDGWIALFRETY